MTTGVWVPTAQALPPRMTTVLLWMRKTGYSSPLIAAWEDWHEVTEDADDFTHWMIPGTPQEATK